jgi:hypothetical protein
MTNRSDDAYSDTIAAGAAAWAKIRESGRKNFDLWVEVAKALQIGRDIALREAGTTKPFGTIFSKASARWLRQNGLYGMCDQERSRALLVLRNLPAITIWRDQLDEAQRRRMNHPNTVYECWRRSISDEPAAAQRRQPVKHVTAPAADTARPDVARSFYSKPRAISGAKLP